MILWKNIDDQIFTTDKPGTLHYITLHLADAFIQSDLQ